MRLKDLEEEAYGPEDYEKIKAKQERGNAKTNRRNRTELNGKGNRFQGHKMN